MTPELSIRSFTSDQYFLDKVFYANSYGLKSLKDKNAVVVDIGAHCGYFSFAAFSLGAKKVYAFEPYAENYRMLLKNISPSNAFIPNQLGLYVTATQLSIKPPEVIKSSYFDFGWLAIDESPTVPVSNTTISCFSLDDILNRIVKEPVDILKINIGYAEIDILTVSKTLESPNSVHHICGESEISSNDFEAVKAKMIKKGFLDCHIVPIQEEEGKSLFQFSKVKRSDVFGERK